MDRGFGGEMGKKSRTNKTHHRSYHLAGDAGMIRPPFKDDSSPSSLRRQCTTSDGKYQASWSRISVTGGRCQWSCAGLVEILLEADERLADGSGFSRVGNGIWDGVV